MHATIASFSSETVTIPVAYSKKFEGLFGNLGYKYIVDLRKLSTDEAVVKTEKLVQMEKELKGAQINSMKVAKKEIEQFGYLLKGLLTE